MHRSEPCRCGSDKKFKFCCRNKKKAQRMKNILTLQQLQDLLPDGEGKPGIETLRLWVRSNKIPCLPRNKGSRMFFDKKIIEDWQKAGRPNNETLNIIL